MRDDPVDAVDADASVAGRVQDRFEGQPRFAPSAVPGVVSLPDAADDDAAAHEFVSLEPSPAVSGASRRVPRPAVVTPDGPSAFRSTMTCMPSGSSRTSATQPSTTNVSFTNAVEVFRNDRATSVAPGHHD